MEGGGGEQSHPDAGESITLKTAAGRQRASPAAASRPAVTAGSRLVRSVRTCWPPRPVNLRDRRSRGAGRRGKRATKHKGSITHTHTHTHTSPQTLQSAPSPSGAGGAAHVKPAKVAPARRNPPSIPGAPAPTLHAHYLRSTKGDWPCKRSSKTRPGPPPPTFQPERPPHPSPAHLLETPG